MRQPYFKGWYGLNYDFIVELDWAQQFPSKCSVAAVYCRIMSQETSGPMRSSGQAAEPQNGGERTDKHHSTSTIRVLPPRAAQHALHANETLQTAHPYLGSVKPTAAKVLSASLTRHTLAVYCLPSSRIHATKACSMARAAQQLHQVRPMLLCSGATMGQCVTVGLQAQEVWRTKVSSRPTCAHNTRRLLKTGAGSTNPNSVWAPRESAN